MHFDNMADLLVSLRAFVKEHPDAYIQVQDVARKLWLGFSALLDDESIQTWTISLGNFNRALKDNSLFSQSEIESIKQFIAIRVDFNNAGKNYLKVISGT